MGGWLDITLCRSATKNTPFYHNCIRQTLIVQGHSVLPFARNLFDPDQSNSLDDHVRQCSVIYHLAAVCRHQEPDFIFERNIQLAELLLNSCRRYMNCVNKMNLTR